MIVEKTVESQSRAVKTGSCFVFSRHRGLYRLIHRGNKYRRRAS